MKVCSSLFAIILLGLAAAGALSCGYENTASVRFSAYAPDFAWPPRLVGTPIRSIGPVSLDPRATTPPPSGITPAQAEKLWQAAQALERKRQYAAAAEAYERFCRLGLGSVQDNQFNVALDKMDLFRDPEVLKQPADLRSYLNIRNGPYRERKGQKARTQLMELLEKGHAAIRPSALFLMASVQYNQASYDDALTLYRKLVAEFPASRKIPVTQFMIAKGLYWRAAWPEMSEDEQESKLRKGYSYYHARRLKAQHRAAEAGAAFEGFIRQHPNHLLVPLAKAWLGAVRLAAGDKTAALRQYLTLLREPDSESMFGVAITSIYDVRNDLKAAELRAIEAALVKEPRLLEPYLYYMLYYRRFTTKRDRTAMLQHCADLAEQGLRDRPQGAITRGLLVRLSQVAYKQGKWAQARKLADRALGIRNGDALLDEAYWMRGAAWHRQQQYWLAIRDFETLRRRFPHSPMGTSAREELAVLYETVGKYGRALEEDFALGYQADVAWLVDVKMTSADLRAYIAQHPNHPKRTFLWYALGIRSMRDGQYRRAKACFAQVSLPLTRKAYAEYESYWYGSPPADPRATLNTLMEWDRKLRHARNRTEKWSVLFGYAKYLDQGPDTLIYNEPAWKGVRMDNLQALSPLDVTHKTQDERLRISYLERDNVLLRAAGMYLRAVRIAPERAETPLILYAAAYCYLRVANYNYFFRQASPRRGYLRKAKALWQRLAIEYPSSPWTRKAARLDRALKGSEVLEGGQHPWGADFPPWPDPMPRRSRGE